MEKMIINATEVEEIRVAIIKDKQLLDLDFESTAVVKKKSNIYKGIVTRREPSLCAVFVEYGAKRQGFLPLKEIDPSYFNPNAPAGEKSNLNELIREGQTLLIQVEKEERGNKGAALTTFITLAGCYLVLMPNSPAAGGISRRIEGDEREEMRKTLDALTLEESMGVIIRTAGVGKALDELQADLDMLLNQWRAIQQAYQHEMAPSLIHQEGDVIIRSIRDNLRKSVSEIIIDDQVAYVKAKRYIEQIKPDFLPNLKLYNSHIPLFTLYQVESQIERAYQREVLLPSGGALVIDRTEALVSIDINSAKATSGADIESTAFNTNLEAADEIARQLKLRDLGGLIVIDFIDMNSTKHQRDVENRLKDALKSDRARIQVGRISRFGLLEMSRQRLRLSLGEGAQELCPRCEGRGTVRNILSHSLSLLRLIEEKALSEKTTVIELQLPVEMATFIMNEKREVLMTLEKRHHVDVTVIANPYLHMPQYKINALNESQAGKKRKPSYELIEQPAVTHEATIERTEAPNAPAAKQYETQLHTPEKQSGFFSRLWRLLGQSHVIATEKPSEPVVSVNKNDPANRTAEGRPQHSNQPNRNRNNNRRRPQGQQGVNRNPQTRSTTNNNPNAARRRPPAAAKTVETASAPVVTPPSSTETHE